IGGVNYVVALHAEDHVGLEPLATVGSPSREPMYVFRVPAPLPRAYAVGCAHATAETASIQALLDPLFDPRREIVLPSGSADGCASEFQGSARISDYRADRVLLEAGLSGPGFVVLLDTFDASWQVRVDGRRE